MPAKSTAPVYRVGAATITRVDETGFALAPERLFAAWDENDARALEERFGTASLDLTNRRIPLRTHLWVVQIDAHTIVVDMGIGNRKSRPFSELFHQLDNPVLARFAAAGFRPEQVDYVLLTHLHVDHVGWNTHWQDGRWVPVFPNATYVFGQRERDFFAMPEGEPRRMVFEDSVLPAIEAGQGRAVSDAGEQILDGIRFLPTFGHSVGHMAIEIRSRGETALFSGDVMHSALQVHRPEWSSVFCADAAQARESRLWLLDRAAQTDATVFAAHFPETSAGKVRRSGSGFEWRYVSPPT
ncbi:MAG: MBL-fold metallo-hydrolase superfamily [uncultured Paraburkholderia sp.]|nr:MAG: MBL-fold metallo-hydrolase superfamily [uncultured Paraburkholderia sp.]CAH2776020.1 MAG: MBL-fold metallo-hydrolase superfamily [uncultured Paraburkholderia sp.]CAH2909267.1 MAG: MBL-fold metallo-hydrolase superfamily [uncultured Paraburkholderia sp.]CAH2910465.1 MAG: MBL-fold metallo-hydrolase superfamily [uncultured Paraburkholderia sp.]